MKFDEILQSACTEVFQMTQLVRLAGLRFLAGEGGHTHCEALDPSEGLGAAGANGTGAARA